MQFDNQVNLLIGSVRVAPNSSPARKPFTPVLRDAVLFKSNGLVLAETAS